ncbi:SMC family ATPase [Eubacteriaceae bacterium ES2]|nr:SMC family ATPase [Eubacteriaceae bacterium ES2]
MKPQKLIMSGFCPYAGEVEIDFSSFDGAGLFLITGETGAGKTTIFDGISYALFGEASGENRSIETLRSDFAKPETPTFVKLVFEDKGSTFEIERNPRYYRPKKRGDSGEMTLQNANASILLPGNAVITGSREVTDKVIELLGINHQQFKQISMIAQGEFLKLLFAGSEDRGKIFRKVFGTEVFEKIQRDLKNKAINLKKELDDIDKGILQYFDGIIVDSDQANSYLSLKDSVHKLSEMLDLLEIQLKKSNGEKKAKSDQVKNLQERLNEITLKIGSGQQLNALLDELERENKKNSQLAADAGRIEILKKALETAKQAVYYVKPKYDGKVRLEKEKHHLEGAIKKNAQVIDAGAAVKVEREEELTKRLAEEGQREALATEIKNLEASFPEYEKLDKRLADYKKSEHEKKRLEEDLLKNSNELNREKAKKLDIEEKLHLLKDVETEYLKLEQKWEMVSKEKNELTIFYKAVKSSLDLAKDLQFKQADCRQKETDYHVFKEEYDRQESLFYREQAGILAENLIANKPCPVCGSCSHPDKARKSTDAPSQDMLNRQKIEMESLRSNWQKSSEDCKAQSTQYDTRLEQLKLDADRLDFIYPEILTELLIRVQERGKERADLIKKIENELATAKENCLIKEKQEKELKQLQKKINSDEEMIAEMRDTRSQIEVNVAALQAEIASIKEKVQFADKKAAEREINKKRADLSALKALMQSAQTAYQEVCDQINEAVTLKLANQEQLEKISREEEKAEQELMQALDQYGFKDPETYKTALLSDQEMEKHEQEIEKFTQTVRTTETKINQLEKQINGRGREDLSALDNDKKELLDRSNTLQLEQENIEHHIKNNQEILKVLKSRGKLREQVETIYQDVKPLSDTANGELSGIQKLAFEQYVQGVYFDMILQEANKRFGIMSGNRYSLVRNEGGVDKRSKSGLEIDVRDRHTAKTRSVKSLSGGESFKASLSLALGLSDVVQNFSGGVQVDTMFIDEGFGTLDSESLETAMDILAELTEGDRLVGIISHLEELKNRIDKKIIISKDPQGSSVQVQV